MLKFKKYCLYLIFVFLLILVYVLTSRTTSTVQPEVKQASIYMDPVSFPSMLQMVEVVKSNPEEPKFIFWERQKNITKDHPSLKNATIFQSNIWQDYRDLPIKQKKKYINRLCFAINKWTTDYPNAQFTLYLNIHHPLYTWSVLNAVPRERIKHIYWYEESYGVALFDDSVLRTISNFEYFKKILLLRDYIPNLPKFAALPWYPSTLYIAHPEEVAKANAEKLNYVKKYAQVKAIDYQEIANSLTEQQKYDLLQLTGLDKKEIALLNSKKPFMLHILGLDPHNTTSLNEVQLADLDLVFQDRFGLIGNPNNYLWLAKEHPWLTNDQSLKKAILKKYPFVHFLPKDFPLEILFLTGHIPEKAFGYSSSVFFALPSTRVLFYIPRPEDPYLPWLLKFGNLRKEQIYAGENEL